MIAGIVLTDAQFAAGHVPMLRVTKVAAPREREEVTGDSEEASVVGGVHSRAGRGR